MGHGCGSGHGSHMQPLLEGADAVANRNPDEPKSRICDEELGDRQLPGAVPGVWDQPQSGEYERALIRRVHHQGFIRYRGEVVFVSESLAGWDVGLRPRQDLSYDLYFARLLLGRLEPETAAFIPVTKLTSRAGEEEPA